MGSLARCVTLASFASILGAFAACGSNASDPPGSGGGSGGTSSGGSGTGGIQLGGTGGDLDTGLNDVVDPDSGCGAITADAKSTPLHLYIMMDKSSSMAGFKWDAAKAGLVAFVKDNDSAGIYVGLKFFPRPPNGIEVCNQQEYSTPDTPFAQLPGNAPAIETAINNETPNGLSTPTWPALGGAILKSIEIVQNNPNDSAAVLLVTDGVPQGPASMCAGVDPTSTAEIAALAAKGVTFGVSTYVIGLPGVDQTFANEVAKAGASDTAILVSNTNVQVEFQNALAKVRGQALPCEYELPDQVKSGTYDTGKVNVQITPGGGTPKDILQTPDCNTADGWYYDAGKTKILLCPNDCDGLKKDYQAKVQIVLGCPTRVVK
jgi:hypothetical protein